jgi:hypothetical protein
MDAHELKLHRGLLFVKILGRSRAPYFLSTLFCVLLHFNYKSLNNLLKGWGWWSYVNPFPMSTSMFINSLSFQAQFVKNSGWRNPNVLSLADLKICIQNKSLPSVVRQLLNPHHTLQNFKQVHASFA